MAQELSQWTELARYWQGRFETDGRTAFASYLYFLRYKHTAGYLAVLNRGLDEMANKAKPAASTKTAQVNSGYTQFVNVNVPAHMKDAARQYLRDADTFVTAVGDIVESGYRFGLSYDEKRDALIASLTCRREGDPNMGKTLTAFAPTWAEAMAVVLFKHYEVCGQIWDTPAERDLFG